MTDATTDNYEQLLRTFPPEKIITARNPAYPQAEGFGGCVTCASGQPCRTRISEDVVEILDMAGLPESEQLACLRWMIAEECSSLTHSMDDMVKRLLSTLVFVLEANGNDLLELPYDPACPQLALLQVMAEEANRREISLSEVTLRLVIKSEHDRLLDMAIPNVA